MASSSKPLEWASAFQLSPNATAEVAAEVKKFLGEYQKNPVGQIGIGSKPNPGKTTAELIAMVQTPKENDISEAAKQQLIALLKERSDPRITLLHVERGSASPLMAAFRQMGAFSINNYNVIVVNLTDLEKVKVPLQDSSGKKYLGPVPFDVAIAHERRHLTDPSLPGYATMTAACKEANGIETENAYRRAKDKGAPLRYQYRDAGLEFKALLADKPAERQSLADENNLSTWALESRKKLLIDAITLEQFNIGCKAPPGAKELAAKASQALRDAGVSMAGLKIEYLPNNKISIDSSNAPSVPGK